jgi:hypothetical protein
LTFWGIREKLSRAHKLRRSYYELLRDDLEDFLLTHGLIESYENFQKKNIDYPFVERRELKPRARIPGIEYEEHNAFLVTFIEDTIPANCKKYIRFFDVNKATKTNLLASEILSLTDDFDRNQKYLDSVAFTDFLRSLISVDYALLIQRDPSTRARDRYNLSHYHVRIDWPIADGAEELAKDLRYIVKDLYEKGDKYAEDLQKKFFEYYGVPVMAGGRRTAAVVAAQYLKRIPCISTVYVSSSESRSVIKFYERGLTKFVLIKLTLREMMDIAEKNGMILDTFTKKYTIAYEEKDGICILSTSYMRSSKASPPKDGKLRSLRADTPWLRVQAQYLLPRPGVWRYPLLPMNYIYG